MKKICLQGFAYDRQSSFLKGCALAPPLIRKFYNSDSSNFYAENGIEISPELVDDKGDFAINTYFDIEDITTRNLDKGVPLITLGGDHSITYPVLRAFKKIYGPINIIHLDAHADLYDQFEGEKYSHACTFSRIMEDEIGLNLFQIGVRTLNKEQRTARKKFDVKSVAIDHWEQLNEELNGLPIYISLDIDVLDPAFAPGVSHHEPGGVSTREVLRFIQNLKGPLLGADLVEFNPTRDSNGITGMLCAKLFKELASKMLSQ